MKVTWIADVLRAAGLRVVELDGWRTRGRDLDPQGVVWHHTATPRSASDSTVDRILRDGHSTLPGPLSQLGLRRDGTFVVVAAGRCNHNGYGLWGNDSIGIEAYNDGVGEPWPVEQIVAYVKGTAAICRHLGWGTDRVKAHRETDPRRKVDPRGIDMNAARGRVAALLNHQEDPMGVPQWAKTAWDWAVSRGIVKDRPNDPATRAEVVTMLHRALHDPEGTVPGWAVEAYRDLGSDINRPEPNAPVTEARLVTLLHRWGIRSR